MTDDMTVCWQMNGLRKDVLGCCGRVGERLGLGDDYVGTTGEYSIDMEGAFRAAIE